MSQLSIVIVNFRTPDLCIDCLASLDEIKGIEVEIIIVDNASNDGSVEKIQQAIDEREWVGTKLICSPLNSGFSAGNNLGIQACIGDYVLLLNSDTIVRPNSIESLMQTLEKNPSIGMVSPRLEWPSGAPQESCFRFHRPPNELIRAACTGLVTKLLRRYEVPIGVTESLSSPEWTSFASVMIRRDVFDQVGLLDDGFFMYFEDVDFCQRARQAGWNIVNNPAARVVHLRGGSSPLKEQAALKKRLPRYFYESRTRYYAKYFGRLGLLKANLYWHLGWLVAQFRKLLNPSYKSNICDQQWRDIWANFWSPHKSYIHPDNY